MLAGQRNRNNRNKRYRKTKHTDHGEADVERRTRSINLEPGIFSLAKADNAGEIMYEGETEEKIGRERRLLRLL